MFMCIQSPQVTVLRDCQRECGTAQLVAPLDTFTEPWTVSWLRRMCIVPSGVLSPTMVPRQWAVEEITPRSPKAYAGNIWTYDTCVHTSGGIRHGGDLH